MIGVSAMGVLASQMGLISAAHASDPITVTSCNDFSEGSPHNLRWAVGQANSNPGLDTINFNVNCVVQIDGERNAQGPIVVTDALTIDGGGTTVITPTSADSFIQVESGSGYRDLTINGVTFLGQGANTSIESSAIMDVQQDSLLTINDSTFKDINSGGYPFLIYTASNLQVNRNTFTNNFTEGGGGTLIYVSVPSPSDGPQVSVNDSQFTNNQAGGIYAYSVDSANSVLSVTNTTFDNDSSFGYNAGIDSYFENTNVTGSTFSNLTSATNWGGAIATPWVNTTLTVSNSTFANNSVTADGGQGGAIYAEGGARIQSSTFVDNSATVANGQALALFAAGSLGLSGNIFAGSTADGKTQCGVNGEVPSIIDPSVANLSVDTSCSNGVNLPNVSAATNGESALVTRDQLDLQPLALNTTNPTNTGATKTIALGANSVARDYYTAASFPANGLRTSPVAGNLLPTTDQRGVARPINGKYDVGAFEAGTGCVTTTLGKIHFAPNSSQLTKASKKKIRTYVSQLASSGCHTVVLNGYTATSTGASKETHAIRVKLSKARNKSVKNYFAKQAKANALTVTFDEHVFGALKPVASNATSAGRAKNRRVEIILKALRGGM